MTEKCNPNLGRQGVVWDMRKMEIRNGAFIAIKLTLIFFKFIIFLNFAFFLIVSLTILQFDEGAEDEDVEDDEEGDDIGVSCLF